MHEAVQIVEYGSAPRSSVSSPTPSRAHQLAPGHSEHVRSPHRHAPPQSMPLSQPHSAGELTPNVHRQPSALTPTSSSAVAMPIAGSSAREPTVPVVPAQENHGMRSAPYAFETPQGPAPYPSLKTLERSLESYPHRPPHRTSRLGGHHREPDPGPDSAAPKFERGVVPPLDPERWERERERDPRMLERQQWENEQRSREMESRMVEPGARHPREPQNNLGRGPAYPSFPLPPPPSAVSQRTVSSTSSPSGSHISHGHNHGPPLPHSHSHSHPQSLHSEPYPPSQEPPPMRHIAPPHPEQLSLPLPQIQTRDSRSHSTSQRHSLPPISTVASDLSVGRDSDRSFPGSAKEGSDFGESMRQRTHRHVQEHPHGNGQVHPHGHPDFPAEEERRSRHHTRVPSERGPTSEGNWQHGRDQRLQLPHHHEYGSGGVSPDSPRSVMSGRHSHPNSLPHSRSQSHSSRPPPLQTHSQPVHHTQYGTRSHEDVNTHDKPLYTPNSAPASSIPSVITSSHPSNSAWPDSDREVVHGGNINLVNTPSAPPASNRSLPPLSLSPAPHGSHGHGPSPYSRPLSASSTHLDRPHHGYPPSHESISPYGYGQSLGPHSAGLSPGYGPSQQRTPVSPGDMQMPSSGTSSSISGSFPLSAGSVSVNGISPVSASGASKKGKFNFSLYWNHS